MYSEHTASKYEWMELTKKNTQKKKISYFSSNIKKFHFCVASLPWFYPSKVVFIGTTLLYFFAQLNYNCFQPHTEIWWRKFCVINCVQTIFSTMQAYTLHTTSSTRENWDRRTEHKIDYSIFFFYFFLHSLSGCCVWENQHSWSGERDYLIIQGLVIRLYISQCW